MMASLPIVLHLLALGAWIGAQGHFAYIAAPRLFRSLGRDRGGEITALLFPGYFRFGHVCAATAAVTSFWSLGLQSGGALGNATGSAWTTMLVILLTLGMLGLNLVVDVIWRPEIADLATSMRGVPDDQIAPGKRARFRRLHGQSMGVQLLLVLLGLTTFWHSLTVALHSSSGALAP